MGRILKSLGGFYYVEIADGVLESKPRGIFRKAGFKPVAGDICAVTVNEDGKGVIEEVAERKNILLRPPLANLDLLFLVVSTQNPAPNLLVLDQLIAIAEYKEIEPVLIITKTDLGEWEVLNTDYRQAGFTVFVMDYAQEESIIQVKEAMKGKLSAFCGNSGVGKSTLLNAIDPRLELETADISQKLGRGRHTTRDVCLYPLDGGGYIADTPGFSSLELKRFEIILKDQLQYCFREFEPYLGECKFMDCLHTVEKGCAVLEAVKAGEIPASRHKNYCGMVEEAKKINEWEVR